MFDTVAERNVRFENDHADRTLGRRQACRVDHRTQSRADQLRSKLCPLSENRPVLNSNYVVKGWLGKGCYSVLYGPSNVGKTFIVLDMAMHVAAGVEWFGHRVSRGAVVYVAAEGGAGIKNRLAALTNHRPEFEAAPFYLLQETLDLHASIDAKALVEAISVLEPALVVIDTLARSMGTGDENSTKDMGAFNRAVDAIRENSGAHVLVVHHSGKNEEQGARGSSALRAATDTEIAVSVTSDDVAKVVEIRSTKQRDFETPRPICVSLKSVCLGEDEDGDPVTSAIIQLSEPSSPKSKPLKPNLRKALDILDAALADHGTTTASALHSSENATSIEADLWCEELKRQGLLDVDKAGNMTSGARSKWQRTKDHLKAASMIRINNGRVWSCRDE